MKKVFTLIILSLVMFSCSKDDIAQEETTAVELTESKTIVYKGISYTVQLDQHGEIDKTDLNQDLIKAISSSHVVELSEENTIYLYDQIDEVNSLITAKTSSLSNKSGVSYQKSGVAQSTGYQHEYYRGFPLGGTGNFAYPSLRPHGFNDLISSAIVTNYSARGYLAQYFEHDNYQGRIYTLILAPGEIKYNPNLRSVGMHDKTSSMVGRYL
ncbi:hypothetical protein [Aquimarina mytili]|uniref:Uncharacterized protein n=1 Tax=Aquimarina mytili TaxID=874423 RepID=A0A936ZQ28_9FLAO|nr:hypothetical protein [Aquimarina mytili]MBL0682222.1 hypothetical protein [Aquimarina mytili]